MRRSSAPAARRVRGFRRELADARRAPRALGELCRRAAERQIVDPVDRPAGRASRPRRSPGSMRLDCPSLRRQSGLDPYRGRPLVLRRDLSSPWNRRRADPANPPWLPRPITARIAARAGSGCCRGESRVRLPRRLGKAAERRKIDVAAVILEISSVRAPYRRDCVLDLRPAVLEVAAGESFDSSDPAAADAECTRPREASSSVATCFARRIGFRSGNQTDAVAEPDSPRRRGAPRSAISGSESCQR